MKTQFLAACFTFTVLLLGMNSVQAQESVTTMVNIMLEDVISIHEESAARDGEVNFIYITADDYHTTKTITVPNSLVVTSATDFDIKVKAGGDNFVNGNDNIPVDVLTLKANGGTMKGNKKDIKLKAKDQKLVNNAPKGSKLTLDLDYEIHKKKASKDILGMPNGTYTQTVTYTATAH